MRTLSLLVTAVIVLGATTVFAAEKKIQARDLPAAVQKAVQEQNKDATIKGYAKEVENGKTTYEVETIVSGHARDLIFDSAGQLLVTEEAVSLNAIPIPAKNAFEVKGKVLMVETVTTGKVVTYEAQIQGKSGKKAEVTVDAGGKPAKP
jgi:uncharacterized membrane protein YkoI